MVQRKAPQRLHTQAEVKRSHVKLEKQSSFNHQQETRRSRGADVLKKKKKMKMERSIIATDLKDEYNSSQKNYMKPTSSSKERRQVTKNPNPSKPPKSLIRQSSLKAIRSLMMKKRDLKGVVVNKARDLKGVVVNKATCSSTLKDSKFPKALELNRGGTEAEGISVTRVCPYTYCSLNGHFHEPLPPLKCFISAKRQLIKTQKSMKLKGSVKGVGKDNKEEFFVEIESYKDGMDQNSELSDEEVDFLKYVESENKVSAIGCDFEEVAAKTECSDCSDEDFGLATLFSDFSRTISLNAEDEDEIEMSSYDGEKECTNCLDDVQDYVFCEESEQQEEGTNPEGEMDKTKLGARGIRKKTIEDVEEMKEFNPRGPHFLSVEPDPDSEHVDLRHQAMDERKNSEEWMIDYALRRKLAPAPKKRVAVLVEAFETVMPQQPVRKESTSGFPHARIIQACN